MAKLRRDDKVRVVNGQEYIRLYDNCIYIDHFLIAHNKRIVVRLVSYDGIKAIHLKEEYRSMYDGKWNPGWGAITIPFKSMIPLALGENVGTKTKMRKEGRIPDLIKPYDRFMESLAKCMQKLPDFQLEDPAMEVWIPKKDNENVKVDMMRRNRDGKNKNK